MNKLKFEIEATSTGYTERVFRDDELVHERVMQTPDGDSYNGRLKQIAGKSVEDSFDGEMDLEDLSDDLSTFTGSDMVGHVSRWEG